MENIEIVEKGARAQTWLDKIESAKFVLSSGNAKSN